MTQAQTEKAEEMFYAALEMESPAERAEFLDRGCRENSELRAAVEEMLAAQVKVEKFFADGGSQ